MKRLPLLLILLLVSLLAVAGPARAFVVSSPSATPVSVAAAKEEDETEEEEDEGEEAGEDDEAEEESPEACEDVETEEDEELCEQEEEEEAAEECLLEDASATLIPSPAANRVKLVLRYHSFEPTSVALDTHLRGGKGALHLGADRARFQRKGVFHDSFKLADRAMDKALAARQFRVDLHAVGTPGYCALHLIGHHSSAQRLRSS